MSGVASHSCEKSKSMVSLNFRSYIGNVLSTVSVKYIKHALPLEPVTASRVFKHLQVLASGLNGEILGLIYKNCYLIKY